MTYTSFSHIIAILEAAYSMYIARSSNTEPDKWQRATFWMAVAIFIALPL